MKGWTRRPLALLASRISDGSHNPPKGVEMSEFMMLSSKNVFDDQLSFDAPRYLSAADFKAEDRRTSVAAGDVLLTIVGTIGRTAVVPPDAPAFTLQRSVAVIRPDSSVVDSRFLMYALMSGSEALNAQARGVAQKGIYLEALREFGIVYPSLTEQRRIVAILDEAFEAIVTAKASAEKNLQNARDLLDNALRALLSDDNRGRVQCTMADVCAIQAKLIDPRDAQYLDLPHVGAGNIEPKTGELIDVLTAREEQLISGKFLFDRSTVLYSKIRPYLMKVVRPDFNGLCSADIYPLTPKAGAIARDYLFYVLLSPQFTSYAIHGSARAGMPKVNRDHLFAYRFSLPPVEEQELIAERLDTLANETQRLIGLYECKLAALEELKSSLLHQAFAGALTAQSAEMQLETV